MLRQGSYDGAVALALLAAEKRPASRKAGGGGGGKLDY